MKEPQNYQVILWLIMGGTLTDPWNHKKPFFKKMFLDKVP